MNDALLRLLADLDHARRRAEAAAKKAGPHLPPLVLARALVDAEELRAGLDRLAQQLEAAAPAPPQGRTSA